MVMDFLVPYRLGRLDDAEVLNISYLISPFLFSLFFPFFLGFTLIRFIWLLLQNNSKSIGNEKEGKKRNGIWQLFEEAQQSMFGSSFFETSQIIFGQWGLLVWLVICRAQ